MGSSALAHLLALAAISFAPCTRAVLWVPVQAGCASVELQASLGDVPVDERQAAQGEPVTLAPAAEPVSTEEVVLAAAATASIAQPAPQPDLPEIVITGASLPSSSPARVVHADFQQSRREDPALLAVSGHRATASRLPRTDVGRRHAGELASRDLAGSASAASRASDGAQSNLPTAVYNPAPLYPADALAAWLGGRVVLYVEVAADGSVIGVRIHGSSGVASLDASALAAVRRWRFSPAASPDAAPRHVAVPIRFVLADPAPGGPS